MSRKCQITKKSPQVGNTVSHANNKSKRRFLPNLHKQRIWVPSQKRFVTLRITPKGLRLINKKGIEAVLEKLLRG